MKREKVEQNLLDARQKIKDINTKYQEKKKVLDDNYASEVKNWKEKEKFWKAKLNEIDNKEKLELISKISAEELKSMLEAREKENKALMSQASQPSENTYTSNISHEKEEQISNETD